MINVAVEPGQADLMLPSKVCTVLASQPPLLGCVDDEQDTERPKRLAAQVLARVLTHHHNTPTSTGHLGGCRQTSQPGADDDNVYVGDQPRPDKPDSRTARWCRTPPR